MKCKNISKLVLSAVFIKLDLQIKNTDYQLLIRVLSSQKITKQDEAATLSWKKNGKAAFTEPC